MSEIRIKENESIDSALRRFKRSCAKAGTLPGGSFPQHQLGGSTRVSVSIMKARA